MGDGHQRPRQQAVKRRIGPGMSTGEYHASRRKTLEWLNVIVVDWRSCHMSEARGTRPFAKIEPSLWRPEGRGCAEFPSEFARWREERQLVAKKSAQCRNKVLGL